MYTNTTASFALPMCEPVRRSPDKSNDVWRPLTLEDDPRSPIKVDIQPSSNQKKVDEEKIKMI